MAFREKEASYRGYVLAPRPVSLAGCAWAVDYWPAGSPAVKNTAYGHTLSGAANAARRAVDWIFIENAADSGPGSPGTFTGHPGCAEGAFLALTAPGGTVTVKLPLGEEAHLTVRTAVERILLFPELLAAAERLYQSAVATAQGQPIPDAGLDAALKIIAQAREAV